MRSRTLFRLSLPLFLSLLGSAAHASYTDTFDGGANGGGWSWGYGDTYESSGGAPGTYLGASVDTVGPTLRTGEGDSPFVGNFATMGVTGMSVDLKVDATDFSIGHHDDGFHVSLILTNTNGTEFDPTDDDYAYMIGDFVPDVASGWAHFDFAIDSTSSSLPNGWSGGSYDDYQSFRSGVTWGSLLSKVDKVEFTMLTPGYGAIFQNWTVGADNVSIRTAPVPEPATMAVLGLGVLGFARRRRR